MGLVIVLDESYLASLTPLALVSGRLCLVWYAIDLPEGKRRRSLPTDTPADLHSFGFRRPGKRQSRDTQECWRSGKPKSAEAMHKRLRILLPPRYSVQHKHTCCASSSGSKRHLREVEGPDDAATCSWLEHEIKRSMSPRLLVCSPAGRHAG